MKNKKAVFSEQTKEMDQEQTMEQQEKIESMTEEELYKFRNSFDPDGMGFMEEEGA